MNIPSLSFLILVFCLLLPAFAKAQYSPGNAYFGTNNYVEYQAGNLPIIVSVPHGGYLEPATIADRVCSNCVTVRDSRTQELSYDIRTAIYRVYGGYPHIIINKLARIKFDANREIVEAALGDPEAETAWYEYHDFIQAAKDSCVANFGSAIFIDLHGHGHPIQRIELGYLLSKTRLQDADGTLDADNRQDDSSIRHLKNVLNPSISFAEILRGNECMGEFLVKRGYPSVPSASDVAPLPADSYFSGGYNTARHGSRDSSQINSMQFELNWTGVRDSDANRKSFARALACASRSFLDQWYFDLDSWDPGHLVTSTADAGPGSLRSALLGAEDGTLITFDPSLNGDTIRLQGELQICADITLQGPGADLLAVSGEDSTRILRIMPGNNVEVMGLSLVRGKTSSSDGGAVLSEGSIRLLNCVLANNYAVDDGGAVAVLDSSASIQLDSCRIFNNSCGDDGGAISCSNGKVMINASTIKDNFSPSLGGALHMNGIVNISNSTFGGNEATSSGGAIRNFTGGSLTCVNSTFASNKSGNRGGAISTNAYVDLNFCTLVGNVANSLGGGIRVPTGGICLMQNSLVANNSGSSGDDVSMFSGAFISNGYNFIGDTTGSSWIAASNDQLGNTAIPLDPLILSLASNGGFTETIALQVGSPCIDNADTTGAPIFDQRGEIRVSGSQADIGSFEFCMPTSAIDMQTACGSYTWMDGITYFSDNNTATYSLSNAAGCDSVLTLNLTLNQIDTMINQTGYTLSANLAGASYRWLDCNNDLNALVGESNQSFTATANGNYAVEITQNGCVDTSACYSITTVGIVENDFGARFAVFPNPTNGKLKIDLGKAYHSINVQITNSAGQVVQTLELQDSQKLDLEILGAAGFYFVEVWTSDHNRASIKVLKQ
ncbi:MAG: choice-of-anchor Q domain-containing protein [Bacteroidia bacterium]